MALTVAVADYVEAARAPSPGAAPTAVALPLPTEADLQDLFAKIIDAALTDPHWAYRLASLLDSAVRTGPFDRHWRSLAAWHQAYAANACFDADLADEPLSRAEDGFRHQNEPGWLAACVWQRNALPWMRAHFSQLAHTLQQAYAAMQANGLGKLAPACQLTLAFTHGLARQFDAAEANLQVAEAAFTQFGDELGVAQARLVRSSLARRQEDYAAAVEAAEEGLSIFQKAAAPVGIARALEHLATAYMVWQVYTRAEELFKAAIEQYAALNLWGLVASCSNNLGQAYSHLGRFAEAYQALDEARAIYERLGWLGALADNCLNSGLTYLYSDSPAESLLLLERAESLYAQIGQQEFQAICRLYKGMSRLAMEQYQLGLREMEAAVTELRRLDAPPARRAEAQIELASAWLTVGQPKKTLHHLEQAKPFYDRTGQTLALVLLARTRAAALLALTQLEEALSVLESGLELAHREPLHVQQADLMRQRGEVLLRLNRWADALPELTAALARGQELGLPVFQAHCLLGLGMCYENLGRLTDARATWSEALTLIADISPEYTWQAYARLAQLAEKQANVPEALAAYAAAMAALLQIRQDFTQPELVSTYLERPNAMMTSAVRLAASRSEADLTPAFIEEGKAQLAVGAFQRSLRPRDDESGALRRRLAELRAGIQWRQTQVRSGRLSLAEFRAQVQPMQATYLDELTALERADAPLALARRSFDLRTFRQAAQPLGAWLALDWWDAGDELVWVAATADDVQSGVIALRGKVKFSLTMATEGGNRRSLAKDWVTLGQALLPNWVLDRLTPHTTLMIAPHGRLHALAWPALQMPDGRPLVVHCTPVLTPSWHSLQLLWHRPHRPNTAQGGLVALTEFDGRYEPLPQVAHEIQALPSQRLAFSLIDRQATWKAVRALAQPNMGLADLAFLHIATHYAPDEVTGRQSGLALADGDVWLDQIVDLAPLPGLVTFSACSGAQQLILRGDEQIGLPLTCLAAGAQTVVGSLWPVLDQDSAEMMSDFYRYYLAGQSPAAALAAGQRRAWRADRPSLSWASFVCLGCP